MISIIKVNVLSEIIYALHQKFSEKAEKLRELRIFVLFDLKEVVRRALKC